MVTYQIEDNLKKYLKSIGLSIYKLEKNCGFAHSYFINAKYNVTEDKLDTILHFLPDLNREWLLTGEGEMTNGLSLAERFETMTKEDKEVHTKMLKEIMLRVRKVIEEKICSSIDEYENRYHLIKGTFNRALKRGDDRVVEGWVKAVWKESGRIYSLDWILTGKGPKFISQDKCIPIISEFDIAFDFNTENKSVGLMDKEWVEQYSEKGEHIYVNELFNSADFVLQCDFKDSGLDEVDNSTQQYVCKLDDPKSQESFTGFYIICGRKSCFRLVNDCHWVNEEFYCYDKLKNVTLPASRVFGEITVFAKVLGTTTISF